MNTNKNLQWGIIFSYITMAAGILVSLTYTTCFALYSLAFCLDPDEKQLLAGVLKKTGIKK